MEKLDELAAGLEATYRSDPVRKSNGSLGEWPVNEVQTN
jgi:hypothetical protein